MEFHYAYDKPTCGAPFVIPDQLLLAHARPAEGAQQNDDDLIQAAFDRPIEAAPLEEQAAGVTQVTILVDDVTRHTPVIGILPHVLQRLASAGVADEDITILVANGTHRTMTGRELDDKLGADVREQFRVRQHDHLDPDHLVDLGTTRDGMPVVVHRLIPEADLVIGIGSVGPHGIMGYSGGAKIAMIGACGYETERWTHWHSLDHPIEDLLGVVDNPLRRNIEEGAQIAGLDTVLNVTMDRHGRLQAAAYGDPVAAHRHLVPSAFELSAAHLPQEADVVVTDAHPADLELWQSVKALYAASLAVRHGGAIVFVAPNPEGVAGTHPNVVELAGEHIDEIRRRVDAGAVDDVIGAAVAALIARIRMRAAIHTVSPGIDDDQALRMGFRPQASIEDALRTVLARRGADTRVTVLQDCGALLPVVRGRNDEKVSVVSAASAGSAVDVSQGTPGHGART